MNDAGSIVADFFVYGTLKRGECREAVWPTRPTRIREGFILGKLYDLGPYPAIRVDESDDEGAGWDNGHPTDLDWIKGEVWSMNHNDVITTLATLDEIEGTNQRGYRNLYDQVLVRVYDRIGSKSSRLALCYQYSSAGRLDQHPRVLPRAGEAFVSWTGFSDAP